MPKPTCASIVLLLVPTVVGIGFCNDKDPSCHAWGKKEECTGDNSAVVRKLCPHTCGVCPLFCADLDKGALRGLG